MNSFRRDFLLGFLKGAVVALLLLCAYAAGRNDGYDAGWKLGHAYGWTEGKSAEGQDANELLRAGFEIIDPEGHSIARFGPFINPEKE